MIAPTHLAFATVTAFSLGASPIQAVWVAIGSLLPDIDTPKSIIGRVFPWSWWLESQFGHRGVIHSLILWLPLLAIGFWFPSAGWLIWGSITHILLDTVNIAGVRLFYPSHRLAIFGGRNMRIPVGSPAEMILFIFLTVSAYGAYWVQNQGGWRNLVGYTGSYEIAAQIAIKAGLNGSIIKGTWRKQGGEIIENLPLLVIGKEGSGELVKLALWDTTHQKIIRPYQTLYPLHVRAYVQEWQWQTHYSSVPMEATGDLFYKPKDKWGFAQAGDTVIGTFKWHYDDL